ncbi:MAG: TonB family protein [bacterium]
MRRPTFYAVALIQQKAPAGSRKVHPDEIKVKKVSPKKEPQKVAAKKPETIKVPKEKVKTAAPLKKEKVKAQDPALDYKEVQKAIAQLNQEEDQKKAAESVRASVDEIKKKLLQQKATELEQESAEEELIDERISFLSQGFASSRESELYRAQVWSLIKSHWSISDIAFDREKEMEVRIVVHLAKDGSILEMEFVKSSGNSAFDNSAWLAIKRVGHFPPFPSEMDVESEEFEVSFVP